MSNFDTHGGYFAPKDYLRVNEGGSHEENPNGGVQIGVDPEGNPNLLEEGEPVYKDYVYSDNITAEKEFLEQNHLPLKYEGKLYSKIADDFVSEAEERPLDFISNNGLRVMLGRLAEAQEGQKQRDQQRELEEELANLSPEELEQLEAILSGEEPAQMMPEEQVAPEQMMGPAEPVQQPMGEMPMMAKGGNLFRVGGPDKRYWRPGGMWTGLREFPEETPIGQSGSSSVLNGDVELNETLNPAYVIDSARRVRQPSYPSMSWGSLIRQDHPINRSLAYGVTVPGVDLSDYDYESVIQENMPGEVDLGELGVVPPVTVGSETRAAGSNLLPTWSRYAGAIGSGLLGLYNVFQSPDKYKQRQLQPYLPEGRIHLQNEVYNPVDQNMVANTIAAQGNATNRALRNSGLGPSSAAAILASDNNTTGNLGTGFLQTWDANNQRRNAVIAANNQAEAQRAQFDWTVDSARKKILNDTAYINGYYDLNEQRLNYGAEGDKYKAISNQISNGLQALSGIGRENFAMNQINTNPAYLGYRVGPNGEIYYYNPRTGQYDSRVSINDVPVQNTNPKPASMPMSTLLSPYSPGRKYSTDPFMGYNNWKLDENKKKK